MIWVVAYLGDPVERSEAGERIGSIIEKKGIIGRISWKIDPGEEIKRLSGQDKSTEAKKLEVAEE